MEAKILFDEEKKLIIYYNSQVIVIDNNKSNFYKSYDINDLSLMNTQLNEMHFTEEQKNKLFDNIMTYNYKYKYGYLINGFAGKHHTDETKENLRKARAKQTQRTTYTVTYKGETFECHKLLEIFERTGISQSRLSQHLHGHFTVKGLIIEKNINKEKKGE